MTYAVMPVVNFHNGRRCHTLLSGDNMDIGYKAFIDYGDTSEADYIDPEELDADYRQVDLSPYDSIKITGASILCPKCESQKTIFSSLQDDWICLSCSEIFSQQLSAVMSDIRFNDRREE